MRLFKKIRTFITPLKLSFIIAVVLHLALFNFGDSVFKLDNSTKNLMPQKVSFKLAAANKQAAPSPSSKNKKTKEKEKKSNLKQSKVEKEKIDKQVQPKESTKVKKKKREKNDSKYKKKNKQKISKPKETKAVSKRNKLKKSKNKTEKDQTKVEEKKIKKIKNKENTAEIENKELKSKVDRSKESQSNNNQNKAPEKQKKTKGKKTKNTVENKKRKPAQKEKQVKSVSKPVDLTMGKYSEVVPPSLVKHQSPIYPEQLKQRGIEGRVILKILITNQGQVTKVEVHKSSGYKKLDLAAKQAVNSWQFEPAEREEQKIDSWILVPIRFRLKG